MEKLLEILNDLHSDVDFDKEEHLIDEGIVDCMDIITIIREINDECNLTITAKDIIPENFNSAKALYALIQRLEAEE